MARPAVGRARTLLTASSQTRTSDGATSCRSVPVRRIGWRLCGIPAWTWRIPPWSWSPRCRGRGWTAWRSSCRRWRCCRGTPCRRTAPPPCAWSPCTPPRASSSRSSSSPEWRRARCRTSTAGTLRRTWRRRGACCLSPSRGPSSASSSRTRAHAFSLDRSRSRTGPASWQPWHPRRPYVLDRPIRWAIQVGRRSRQALMAGGVTATETKKPTRWCAKHRPRMMGSWMITYSRVLEVLEKWPSAGCLPPHLPPVGRA
mmetsp:Transcript_6118/g.17531  ORF Transcript_6118/g.17531 Transcript_6118/m.17531 type:complete len:257 (+) Transcript_6118:2137-2907(+)